MSRRSPRERLAWEVERLRLHHAEGGTAHAVRERAKELLQVNGVTWQTQAALAERVARAEQAEHPPASALAPAPEHSTLAEEILAAEAWVRHMEEHVDPPLVQVNLERAHVHALQARAAVQVYTLLPDVQFGMPMSIIEALCSGCCVVVPERSECREYAGPGFRGYRTPDDIERHCREVLAGGAAIDAEREAITAYGRERFCDPSLGLHFMAELAAGVGAVRRAGQAAGSRA